MKINTLCLAFTICAALCSCTVKEDRVGCPCHLDIYVEDSRLYTDRLAISGWSAEGERLFIDRIAPDDYPDAYDRKVGKSYLSVCAYGGQQRMSLKGDRLTIPEGSGCDRIWAYRSDIINATGERAEAHLWLHKQYAELSVRMDRLTMEIGDITLRVTGNVNGMDIRTLEAMNGPFSCFAGMDKEMNHTVCLPRQYDDSLKMEIYINGVLERTVALGELITATGYSWAKEDLDDIFITLGLYLQSTVTISINSWETENYNFKI